MGLSSPRTVVSEYFARLARGTALACIFSTSMMISLSSAAHAQDAAGSAEFGSQYQTNPDAKMLLQADNLIVDKDQNTVTAAGNVQIEYDGNRLVARQVVYNQKTKRMVAKGNVEIVERDGNRIYSDEMDVTDDFRDGFVNGLRVETVDDTRFAAESAERSLGEITTFNNGVYTACRACEKDPSKPVLWQVKAKKIIWNGTKKTVRFEGGRFEMFGKSLFALPSFEIADPTIKRKSGFLFPSFLYKDELGFGVRAGYFWNLAPNYDITTYGTALSKQGFLSETEWRHRLENGSYNIRVAGIYQAKPGEFGSTTVDAQERFRAMASSKGDFKINPRWSFGWDVIAQTDKNFSRTYKISGYSDETLTSNVYLRGINGRNHLDINFYKFKVQEDVLNGSTNAVDTKQPWVLPSVDYLYTVPGSVYGGELTITSNLQGIYRETSDIFSLNNNGNIRDFIRGVKGSSARLTTEAEWKRTFISEQGLVITPLLALRGDAIGIDTSDTFGTGNEIRSQAFRGMATAGLEVRWPILFSSTSMTQILEPTAQIFVRNDEPYAGRLPNEDAQSFVFDATSLFQRDKFSGYDRVEGGTRANLGLRYSGNMNNGWSIHGLAGQSFHLGGLNSFATSDFVGAGANSGLEGKRSDYVAMLGLSNNTGLAFAARGRFDKDNFDIQRGELEASHTGQVVQASVKYAYIAKQPDYGYDQERQEVSLSGSTRFKENWRVFGSGTYDIVSETLVKAQSGLAYDDECFTYSMAYIQSRSPGQDKISHSVGFNISFRTLGDLGSSF
ncbi:LPS-assembly protein LptD [Pseudochrobactrum sp. sp1633]|uniref:LPS-assembly protein LptD n=1 Tax=Pseudochrobactrum sp. sp1633 TaxID=3036706 RepID=UPI0025A51B29|nr:LPS-assembly protein LptD [Pseudochrobactrum sp. sp1633]MDM8346186.1 LPS-assembly protein LptD [Pseudochrobactrum sp. sp1633]HWD13749.1 LPS-assembly protein LptD [Pseudochrobactrum sp.]